MGYDRGDDNVLVTATLQPIAASLFSPHTDGTFATPDNRFAYDSASGRLYYDARGSAPGSSSALIANLTNHPHLGAANLFFTSRGQTPGERLRRTRQNGLADFVNRLRGGWPAPMKVTGRAEFVVPP